MLTHDVKPEIEAFDLSRIHQAAAIQRDQRLKSPAYIQFVMGVKNAMPADRETFDYSIRTVERLLPGSEWCAAGIGPAQITLNEWCITAGGHARTGLEDNIRLDRDALAPSNAALVNRLVQLCHRHDRPVATPSQSRTMLGLRKI